MASAPSAPGWARALVRFFAPKHRLEDVLGDLEEAHRGRLARRGRAFAWVATHLDALEMATTLLFTRLRRGVPPPRTPAEAATEDALGGGAVSWLDFKLGLRMLFKYPGLTLVAGGTIALAIAMGVGTFEFLTDFLYPKLPLDEGDRIVQIRQLDTSEGRGEARILHDYVAWRDELRSVDEIGAFQSYRRTLRSEGQARVLTGAAMTASAFGIARVPPLVGRPLLASDEAPDGAAVAVIGHDLWHTLFGGDPGVIGATARLGSDPVTIVGVMPEGFGWPWAHDLWTPLRADVLDYERGEGPPIEIVARLADGVDIEEARAELEAVGARAAADHPETHEHLRPEIQRYGRVLFSEGAAFSIAAYSSSSVFFGMLLLLVCGNVGLLLFARTAARERELVVRSALGAGRRRIVGQLFAEALVLGGLASGIGLSGAHLGLAWVHGMFERFWADEGQILGFWADASLSPIAVLYALAWTVVAAVISGVLPALRITGRQVQPRLQRTGAGSALEFGRLWTGVIVAQVAITVAFVPIVILLGGATAAFRTADYGFPAQEYLSLEVAMDRQVGSSPAAGRMQLSVDERYRSAAEELRRRVTTELDVQDVTVVGELPGGWHEWRRVEVDGPDGLITRCCPQTARIDVDFFDAVGAPIVSGRGFEDSDYESGARVAVANEAFVSEVLGGRDAVGRRVAFVRYDQDPDQPRDWYEIVGVVRQIAMTIDPVEGGSGMGLYIPLEPDTYPLRMAMRVGPDPLSLAPRLHRLASEIDSELQVAAIRPLDESAWQLEMAYSGWFWVVLAAGGAGLILANAGIYAIMSFTVARRTREIGVRVALGADRRRIVWGVFARTLKQVGLGVLLGGLIFAAIVVAGTEFSYVPRGRDAAILLTYLAAMLGACLTACLVPTRRALAIEPTEALRQEG